MTHQHSKAHPDVLAQLQRGSIEGALTVVQNLRLDYFELQLAYRAIFEAIRGLSSRLTNRDSLSGVAFRHLLSIGSLELASEALALMSESPLQAQFSMKLQGKLTAEMASQTCCVSEDPA